MSYVCDGCGESFRTLSRKRLHDCPEGAEYGGDTPTDEFDTSGMTPDEMAEKAVAELLICDVCGYSNDGTHEIDTARGPDGVSVAIHFECSSCGAWNDNSATLGGTP